MLDTVVRERIVLLLTCRPGLSAVRHTHLLLALRPLYRAFNDECGPLTSSPFVCVPPSLLHHSIWCTRICGLAPSYPSTMCNTCCKSMHAGDCCAAPQSRALTPRFILRCRRQVHLCSKEMIVSRVSHVLMCHFITSKLCPDGRSALRNVRRDYFLLTSYPGLELELSTSTRVCILATRPRIAKLPFLLQNILIAF